MSVHPKGGNKRTESSEGQNYVKPILLEESLFGNLYHGIAGYGQRRWGTKRWPTTETKNKKRDETWERITTNKGGWPGREKVMVALRGEARVGLDTRLCGQAPSDGTESR